jgi:Helix-turn-helix domain
MTAQEADRRAVTFADLDGRLFATAPEVAAIFGVDIRTVRRAIADGQIPGQKIGAWWYVPAQWIRQTALLEPASARPGPETSEARS